MSRQAYNEVATYTDPTTGGLKAATEVEVFVYEAGTTNKVSIFESRTGGAALANPFISATGMVSFWTNNGDYDIKFHDTKIPSRFGDYTIGWVSSPVVTEIRSGELSNEGDIEWSQDSKTGAWVPQLKAGSVGTNEMINGSITSPKFKPTAGIKAATANKELTEFLQDISGCVLEITPSIASILRVNLVVNKVGLAGIEGNLLVDGVAQEAKAWIGNGEVATTAPQVFDIPLTAAAHTIKLQAKKFNAGAATLIGVHTRFAYDLRTQ